MSAVDLIQARLSADATLTSALTGGVLLYRSLPAEVNPTTLPGIFNGVRLKPFAVVKGRVLTELPGGLRDIGYMNTRQVVEIYLYDDKSQNWSTLYAAADRIYALLQDTPVNGVFQVQLSNEVNDEREQLMPALRGAVMLRRDYEVIGRKTS
jgi:hypothetical protein